MTVSTAGEVAIRCDDLSILRDRGGGDRERVVDGVDLTLAHGGTLALMGPVGSGKSSLVSVLAGAREPGLSVAGGDATVEGVSIKRGGRARRVRVFRTGWLPQGAGAALPPRLTVEQVIAAPVTERTRRADAHALAVRVAVLLDELGLPLGAAAKYPYELSAGMRQRVALARALMLQPRVLIADDGFANLDLRARATVVRAIVRRRDETGMATLLAGNDVAAAQALGAATMVLREGHVVASGNDVRSLRWSPGAVADGRLIAS